MMSSLVSATGVAMLYLLGGAGGHMVMNKPVPYNLHMAPLLQVNPISSGLYPFPCHNKYDFTERTPVEAGGTTLVNFTGGAQHGGGSCQFSITYDEPVDGGDWNKSAVFKTIYSIIGGCPAVFTDETHNLAPVTPDENLRQDGKHCGNDAGIDCIRQFRIQIPKFVKNGQATFAWTWFNKIGNKEMYMNCAPVYITGGTDDAEQLNSLPNIFIANYPNDPAVPNCITGTSADKVVVNFPNPGKYGRVLEPPLEPATKPANYCTEIPPPSQIPTFLPGLPPQDGNDDNHHTASSSASKITTTTTTTTTPSSATTTSAAWSVGPVISAEAPPANATIPRIVSTSPPAKTLPTTIATTFVVVESTSIDFATVAAETTDPAVNTTATATATATVAVAGGGGGGGGGGGKGKGRVVPCPAEDNGKVVCVGGGGDQFGLCDKGWAAVQAVAEGTKCRGGDIVYY